MKKLVVSVIGAAALLATPALSADLKMVTKAPAPVVVSPWDIAFGSALMSDYSFRGITQSNHQPSVAAYFEPRYNISSNFQLYAGVAGESISFPNRAAAEVDLYAGIRPTFGPLALDFGAWYYWYPGGMCFNAAVPGTCAANGSIPINGNVIKADLSFWEFYAKGVWTVNDIIALGGNLFYDPSWLNSGASGTYASGTLKLTAPGTMLPNGLGAYVSGELGRYWFGTTDGFYGFGAPGTPFFAGVPLPAYTTWNAGVGFTWKVFTLDLRYIGTDLSKANCNVLTGDQTATFAVANITPINPGGFGSNWCGSTFVAKFSADLTLGSLK